MSTEQQDAKSNPPSSLPAARLLVGAVLCIGAVITAGALLAKFQDPRSETPEPPFGPQKELPSGLKELADKHFRNWPKGQTPELVVVVTGEQHNYLQPCGCTRPMYGGLERRYNLLQTLRKHGLEVVAVDLGDIYYPSGLTDQARMKFKVSMKALSLMRYDALAVGKQEFRYPLLEGLADTVLNEKPSYRILAANLLEREANYPSADGGSMIGDSVVSRTKMRVGVVGTIGQSTSDDIVKIDPTVKFGGNPQILPAAFQALKDADVRILLYQGTYDEAKKIPELLPQLDAIVCLSAESDPPGQTTQAGKAQIIRVGHKGRHIGILSFFKKGEAPRYDLMQLGEEFETAEDNEKGHPLVQLMENYTKEVKAKDFRGRVAKTAKQHPLKESFPKLNVAYVGSEKCKDCHKEDYKIWDKSKHSTAFGALEEARKPSLRQYDPECVQCHTTGYGYRTGFMDEKSTKHLLNVGCESCHGPGSLHVADPKNPQFQLKMSPWKQKANDLLPNAEVEKAIDLQTCQKCHDVDNDPYFKFNKFWPQVAHGKKLKK